MILLEALNVSLMRAREEKEVCKNFVMRARAMRVVAARMVMPSEKCVLFRDLLEWLIIFVIAKYVLNIIASSCMHFVTLHLKGNL
jgi:hypothetical protein